MIANRQWHAGPWLAAALLAGCAQVPEQRTPSPPPLRSGECNTASAQFALGRNANTALEAEVRQRTGATVVQVLRPRQPMTMDFNAQRLNLEVDASGRVLAARCG